MVLTTICQLPFFHQDLQWCIRGLLTKHDGEIQLLRVDVGFQLDVWSIRVLHLFTSGCDIYLVTQLISMELLDIASNYSLLRCSPPSSFIQMQAVMCQVACWAGRIWGRWHEFGAGISNLAHRCWVGVVDDVNLCHDCLIWMILRFGLREILVE